MKKTISLLLALMLCLSLCACGKPSVENCVLNANTLVSCHQSYFEECYTFTGKYIETANVYVITMSVDTIQLEEVLKDSNPQYTDIVRKLAIKKLDENTGKISIELDYIKKLVMVFFQDTDITVTTYYQDQNGKIIAYN